MTEKGREVKWEWERSERAWEALKDPVRSLLSGFLIFFFHFIPQPSAPQLAASPLGRRALQYYNEVICIYLRCLNCIKRNLCWGGAQNGQIKKEVWLQVTEKGLYELWVDFAVIDGLGDFTGGGHKPTFAF